MTDSMSASFCRCCGQQRLVLLALGGLLGEQRVVGGVEVAELLVDGELLVLDVLGRVALLGQLGVQLLRFELL